MRLIPRIRHKYLLKQSGHLRRRGARSPVHHAALQQARPEEVLVAGEAVVRQREDLHIQDVRQRRALEPLSRRKRRRAFVYHY